jgi:hypothetical protein
MGKLIGAKAADKLLLTGKLISPAEVGGKLNFWLVLCALCCRNIYMSSLYTSAMLRM